MAAKYIVFHTPDGFYGAIFDGDAFFHEQIAEVEPDFRPVGAGFVRLDPSGDLICEGESKGLRIGSRGKEDALVLDRLLSG